MPSRKDIFPVYAILVFLIFSWALYRFFWYLPSWLEYLSIPSILIILCYSLAFALLESLVMMGFFVLLAAALPKAMFRRQFVAQGSLLALGLGVGAYLIQRQVSMIYRWEPWQVGMVAAGILSGVLILLAVSAFLFKRFPRLVKLAEGFAERMTVFAIVYLPLSAIAWVVVIIRNIMGALA